MVARVVSQLVKPSGASLLLAEFRDRYPTNLAAFQNLLQVITARKYLKIFRSSALSFSVVHGVSCMVCIPVNLENEVYITQKPWRLS